jgi:hypothetical protein
MGRWIKGYTEWVDGFSGNVLEEAPKVKTSVALKGF